MERWKGRRWEGTDQPGGDVSVSAGCLRQVLPSPGMGVVWAFWGGACSGRVVRGGGPWKPDEVSAGSY